MVLILEDNRFGGAALTVVGTSAEAILCKLEIRLCENKPQILLILSVHLIN
jgi:hypothetical protein